VQCDVVWGLGGCETLCVEDECLKDVGCLNLVLFGYIFAGNDGIDFLLVG